MYPEGVEVLVTSMVGGVRGVSVPSILGSSVRVVAAQEHLHHLSAAHHPKIAVWLPLCRGTYRGRPQDILRHAVQ